MMMPVAHYNFDLPLVVFRDALALRYHCPLFKMPAFCDGCGSQSSMEHALDSRKEGLVIRMHKLNVIRDFLCSFFSRTQERSE